MEFWKSKNVEVCNEEVRKFRGFEVWKGVWKVGNINGEVSDSGGVKVWRSGRIGPSNSCIKLSLR